MTSPGRDSSVSFPIFILLPIFKLKLVAIGGSHQGTGDGRALLLASGELGGSVGTHGLIKANGSDMAVASPDSSRFLYFKISGYSTFSYADRRGIK